MSNPKKLGKYEIVKEIGRGNMGVVYLAHDQFYDRQVAIKSMLPKNLKDGKASDRNIKMFFNEASASSFVSHPNIVQIYDAYVQDDSCYLVMEYVEGTKTLLPHTVSNQLLPLNFVIEVIYKLAKALDHAHRQGVTHRDIKPSNVLLTRDNDVKLADYGIALIDRDDYTQTQVDGVIGTPSYMSPEQISNETVTYSSDIFSLGIVAYQLMTGLNPFKGESFQEIYKKINYTHPPELSEFRSDLPKGISSVVKKMLQKSVDKRYKTALDVAADLSVVVDTLEPTKGETGLDERFKIARSLNFFHDFADAEIWEFIRSFDWESYKAREQIIRQDEIDNSFYVLASGVVSVGKDGVLIERIQEGYCFGEMGYVSGAKRTASVIAHTDVSLIRVNAQLMERASAECQNRFLKVFVNTLTDRLSQTTEALANKHLV